MTRDEFAKIGAEANLSYDDIQKAMNERRQLIGPFDDEKPSFGDRVKTTWENSAIKAAGSRLSEYPENLREGLNKVQDSWIGENVEAPLGAAVRTASNAAGEFIPKPIKKAGEWFAGKAIETPGIKQAAEFANEKIPESTKYNLGTTAGIASLLTAKPGLKVATEIEKRVLSTPKFVGKGVEKFGKFVKGGEAKIPASIAKNSYGRNLMEQKNTIINDLADYGETKGGNLTSAKKALSDAEARLHLAEQYGMNLKDDPTIPKYNPSAVATKGLDVSKLVNVEFVNDGEALVKTILNDWERRGLNMPGGIDNMIEAKRSLNRQGDLFSKGLYSRPELAARIIKKNMYFNLIDEMGKVSPEIKALNTEAKHLLDVHEALSAAASRVSNHDAVGLTDHVLGIASLTHPGTAVPLFVAKKLTGNGKAGNLLIRAGRFLQGKKDNSIGATLRKTAYFDRANNLSTAWEGKEAGLPSDAETPKYIRNKQAQDAIEKSQSAREDAAFKKESEARARREASVKNFEQQIEDEKLKEDFDLSFQDELKKAQEEKSHNATANAIRGLRPSPLGVESLMEAIRKHQSGKIKYGK